MQRYIPSKEQVKRFEKSREWQELRLKVLQDNEWKCSECKKKGKHVIATIGHHIKPKEKYWDLRLKYDNILPVCRKCHEYLEKRVSKLKLFIDEWDNFDSI